MVIVNGFDFSTKKVIMQLLYRIPQVWSTISFMKEHFGWVLQNLVKKCCCKYLIRNQFLFQIFILTFLILIFSQGLSIQQCLHLHLIIEKNLSSSWKSFCFIWFYIPLQMKVCHIIRFYVKIKKNDLEEFLTIQYWLSSWKAFPKALFEIKTFLFVYLAKSWSRIRNVTQYQQRGQGYWHKKVPRAKKKFYSITIKSFQKIIKYL